MTHIKQKNLWNLLGMFLVLGILLYVFQLNRHWISNVKPSYILEVYFPSYQYALFNIGKVPDMLLAAIGARTSSEAGPEAQSIPVLLYHGIVETPDGGNILLQSFREHMFALKKAGWNAVSFEDFHAFVRGEKKLPQRSFLLTFDDGRKDSYYPADPILWALGYHAHMFAIEKYSVADENAYYLTKKEIQRMIRSGRWTIGSHGSQSHGGQFYIDSEKTLGRFFGDRLWLPAENRLETAEEFVTRVNAELSAARKGLESVVGTPVISFAAPFGAIGETSNNFPGADKIFENSTRAVYSLSFFQYSNSKLFSHNYPRQLEEPGGFYIKRISVNPSWTAAQLIENLEKGMAKELPFEDSFTEDRGWVSSKWGNAEIMAGTGLKLSSAASSTGSVAILDGSRTWTNYEIQASVDWTKGSNIYLWGRLKDANAYVACNFGKTLFHIEQMLGGETRVIKGIEHNLALPSELTIGMRAKDRRIECLINDTVIAETQFLDPQLHQGGVGFKTWDALPQNSELLIRHVYIKGLP